MHVPKVTPTLSINATIYPELSLYSFKQSFEQYVKVSVIVYPCVQAKIANEIMMKVSDDNIYVS